MPTNPQNQIEIAGQRGKMIAVCSAKGGVGRTVLSTNLAVALAGKGIRTCIVDGCFQFGDIHLALDLQPMFSIKDVIDQIESIDAESLWHYLNRHDSGLRILTAPPRPEYVDLVTTEVLNTIVRLLLSKFHHVVVDTLSGLSEHTLYFIEKADQILLITDLEMATLKNTKMMLDVLTTLDLRHKVNIVVNRSTMQSVISSSDVPKILGEDSIIYIPNDFEVVSKSMSIGLPFVSKHRRADITKTVLSMAEQCCSVEAGRIFEPPSNSLMKSIFHKLKGQKERTE